MPTIDQILAHSKAGGFMRDTAERAARTIAPDDEYARVAALEARPAMTPELIEVMSAGLRTREWGVGPDGAPQRNQLRELQATALRELYAIGGCFAPIRIGGGKTLPTLLAATITRAARPLLIVPANLREKTRRAFAAAIPDWHVRMPRLLSYQEIAHPNNERILDEIQPDLLILDECQYAADDLSTTGIRVERCIERYKPMTMVLSGSLITEDLMLAWRFAVMALRLRAPVPIAQAVAERWAVAVNRSVGALHRVNAGALDELPLANGGGFWRHFRSCRGVVPTTGVSSDDDCNTPLTIQIWQPELSPKLQQLHAMVTEGIRPDGELLTERDVPNYQCMASEGFYHVWDPMPPQEWLRPRRAYNAYVRGVKEQKIEHLDSPALIARALDAEHPTTIPPNYAEGRMLRRAWLQVEDTFTPNPVPVWVDDSPLVQIAERAAVPRTVTWVKYTATGTRLAELAASAGVRYFPGQTDPERDAKPGAPIVLQIQAHSTGINLQHHWHRALYVHLARGQRTWDQSMGRVHRSGQTRDVEVTIRCAIPYHGEALSTAYAKALGASRASESPHKLVDATWI